MRTTALLILIALGLRAQEPPPSTAELGAFALPDPDGARLLSLAPLADPASLHTALCTGGRRFTVRFERHQEQGPGYNGRQTPANFDLLPGSLYRVLDGKVPDVACFLAAAPLLSSAAILPVQASASPKACDPAVQNRIAASRGRPVQRCWSLAADSDRRQLLLVEFERRDKDALAAVVLLDDDRIVSAGYPAVFDGEGKDLWRVDDGGRLSPEGWSIVFLLRRAGEYTLGVAWQAGEGASLAVFASHGDSFSQVLADYWYQSPL